MTTTKHTILFLHGKEGTPTGTKPTFLENNGYRVLAPSLPKNDWQLSCERAKEYIRDFKPDAIVGSSRGGALACGLETSIPKILIAPAYKKFGVTNPQVNHQTNILHCLTDDLVDYNDSVELKDIYDCKLIRCGLNHRMSDKLALENLLIVLEDIL